MPRARRTNPAPLALLVVGLAACSGGNAASLLVDPPAYEPAGQTKCHITKTPLAPLIVEWPSADRAALESQVRRGMVAVRYQGCEMEVLRQCTAKGRYRYAPVTRKLDRVTIKNTDDLYANVPLGAAKLEATLKRAGALEAIMTIVGRLEADTGADAAIDPQAAECARATHLVAAVTVGAFSFHAGGDASVGAGVGAVAGAGSTAKREQIAEDGDADACKRATSNDERPPENCSAFLRLEVVPIAGRTADVKPICPEGSTLEGGRCVRAPRAAELACPPGTTSSPTGCIAAISTACPPGARFEPGRGCVGAGPAPAPAPGVPSRGPCPAGMAWIEGGTFTMGSERGESVEYPEKRLAVSPFCLDVTEVTVASYDACARSGACAPAPAVESPYPMSKESLCNEGRADRRQHPINCVDWKQAEGFCRARGGRLPAEPEWEFAARGGAEGRLYPWGALLPGPELLNACGLECVELGKRIGYKLGALYPSADAWATTAPVGAVPGDTSRWGVQDLGGNVMEWTATPWCNRPGLTSCGDPRRSIRGGSWATWESNRVRAFSRRGQETEIKSADLGFRCAKTP